MKTTRALLSLLLLLLLTAHKAPAYSVLTHEAIIDSAWDTDIKPRLQKRYPAASDDDLLKAHAYAYGGCIIQDMGYYPFASKLFSDLTHYVRSGDFVVAMIRIGELERIRLCAGRAGALRGRQQRSSPGGESRGAHRVPEITHGIRRDRHLCG